jgi:hypothetical protein
MAKKFIHLRHDPGRSLISGIEFDRFEELAPGVRPTRCMHDLGSTDMIVRPSQIRVLAVMTVAAQTAKTPILIKKKNRLYLGVDEWAAHPSPAA